MATTKKKTDDLDYTNQPQAVTQEDVNNQDSRTRLWQSLTHAYNKQKENTRQAYEQAFSDQSNELLNRGMQRSSYGMQSLANLRNKGVEAEKDIDAAQIADYQNRIAEIEQQENEEAWRQKEFDYKVSQDELSQQNFESQFNYQKERDAISDAFQEKQWEAQQAQWREEFDYNKMSNEQKLAYETVVAIVGQGNDPSDALLKTAGISRADANAMKAKARSSGRGGGKVPDWKKLGYSSEAEYLAAQMASTMNKITDRMVETDVTTGTIPLLDFGKKTINNGMQNLKNLNKLEELMKK